MDTASVVLGGSPGETWGAKIKLAFLRSVRTFLQGVAGAFPTAGAGVAILTTDYWTAFGFSILAAAIAAGVSFLQNVANVLPADPTQVPTGSSAAPAPSASPAAPGGGPLPSAGA